MELEQAAGKLAALSNATRLAVFRLLVRRGTEGMAAGEIAEACGLPANTLSFHLKELSHAGLATGTRDGRRIVYAIDPEVVRELLRFLTEDCCQGRPELCLPEEGVLVDAGACGCS